jgi:putative transposase
MLSDILQLCVTGTSVKRGTFFTNYTSYAIGRKHCVRREKAMPRGARLDSPGTLHHVMIRGIERKEIVRDDKDRKDLLSRMGEIALETNTGIYAWVIMNNHAHIFLRSGPLGLPMYMRRLLSGYGISFNRRHDRHGHLFQNRYKSIVCEEDSYFKELVRYIHLNPLRGGLVNSLQELDQYAWSGHAVLMGRLKKKWQDDEYVLKWFGDRVSEARRAYRNYVSAGIDQGERPDLVGGGLIRSQGGWSAVKAMRRLGVLMKSDERILGSGNFVETVLTQADEKIKYQFPSGESSHRAVELIEKMCEEKEVSIDALRSGSRTRAVSRLRSQLAEILVKEIGLSLSETARQLGVTTSAIANSLNREGMKV